MATSSAVLCGVCDLKHATVYAEYWCPECEEGLCNDCHSYHSLSKASRTHSCIPVDQYNKLPSSISTIAHHCKDHGIKYTNYCSTHDILCCPDCISKTHGECKGFLSLSELIKTAKTSTLLDNMEQSLQDIEKNIEKVIQNRQQNLSSIRQQREKFYDDLKKLRDKINSQLDILEQNLKTELNVAEKKIQTKLENLIERLSDEIKSVQALKTNIQTLKEHASDLQAFLGSRTYHPEVEKAEKYMKSLTEDGSLEQFILQCKTNDTIYIETLRKMSFGSVSAETGPPSLVLTTKKEKQAQILKIVKQPSSKSISDIKLSLLNTYDGISGSLGCAIYPNGKLILTNNNKLCVLSVNGTVDKVIPCSSSVKGVTIIDDRSVAVSKGYEIDIININSNRTEKVIKTSNRCYGLTHHKGTLLWCEQSKGLQRMNLSDWSITTLVKQDQLPLFSYVTTYGDKIYQTNNVNKTVTCFTIKGEKIWEYKNPSVLKTAIGITVDSSGNTYVTSDTVNDVVVISADGREGKQLLSQKDGLDYSWGIYYDKTKNTLLVVNQNGPAFLYQVSQ